MKESYWNKYLNLPPAIHTDTVFTNSLKAMGAKIAERAAAKKNKDYALADKIRNELKEQGILLEDTPQGTTWKKA